MLPRKTDIPTLFYNSSFCFTEGGGPSRAAGDQKVPAVLLVLILDQAQFVLQALAVAQQVTVLFQQPVVLLDDSGCRLLLPLVLLQLTHQLLSEQHTQSLVTIRAPATHHRGPFARGTVSRSCIRNTAAPEKDPCWLWLFAKKRLNDWASC